MTIRATDSSLYEWFAQSIYAKLTNVEAAREFIAKLKESKSLSYLLNDSALCSKIAERQDVFEFFVSETLRLADQQSEVVDFIKNPLFVKTALDQYMINENNISRLNACLNETEQLYDNADVLRRILKTYEKNTSTNITNREIHDLAELTKNLRDLNFTQDQKKELFEIAKNHRLIQAKLSSILRSNLQEAFDFDQMKSYFLKLQTSYVLK